VEGGRHPRRLRPRARHLKLWKDGEQAKSRLREAVSLFIEEAEHMGTLSDILEDV
jgi:hypothetical protein